MSAHDRLSFACGETVFERVLLAIINAHTTAKTKGREYERLNTALKALFGCADEYDEALKVALAFMLRGRQRDVFDREIGALCSGNVSAVRSVSELATTAASIFLVDSGMAELSSTSKRLETLFNDQRRASSRQCFDAARDAMEADAVKRVCAELAEWSIPTRL